MNFDWPWRKVNNLNQSGSLKTHEDVIHKGIRYDCEICGEEYTTIQGLNNHKVIHPKFMLEQAQRGGGHTLHPAPISFSHRCEYCEKAFMNSATLKRHITNVHEVYNAVSNIPGSSRRS